LLTILSGVLAELLSSPSVSAIILNIMLGWVYFNFLRLVIATSIQSYKQVLPPGLALSTSFMKFWKSLLKSHILVILLEKQKSYTRWLYSKAIVLSANAEKKALTAPILEISLSAKKEQPIEPLMSYKTTMASFGSSLTYSMTFFYYSSYFSSSIFSGFFT